MESNGWMNNPYETYVEFCQRVGTEPMSEERWQMTTANALPAPTRGDNIREGRKWQRDTRANPKHPSHPVSNKSPWTLNKPLESQRPDAIFERNRGNTAQN
jgi:hypothetical protein